MHDEHQSEPNEASLSPRPPVEPAAVERQTGFFGTLHWPHWLVIFASLTLTVTAWRISEQQIEEKAQARFERNTTQVIDLVLERLKRYEDALWAGVTFMNIIGVDVDYETWRTYAQGISIERKYPGINGIGVIYHVKPSELDAYLQFQRQQRPGYDIHPPHDNPNYWPITYITPVRGNEEAVGLDISHESNRYAAAQQSRDTGTAQITGPITLVQDDKGMPGFLFYVPVYNTSRVPVSLEGKRDAFEGLVYAPFVVRKLMDGVLARELRRVNFSIRDGDTVIYDEHLTNERSYDPDPLFVLEKELQIYGRVWNFDFRSTLDFRRDANTYAPTAVLVGGILVHLLLVVLFVQIARSHRRSKAQTRSLQLAQAKLAQANDELSQFNYRTSHDLIAPLKTIQGYVDLSMREVRKGDLTSMENLLGRINEQALRLDRLVLDLLNLCRIDRLDEPPKAVDMNALIRAVEETLEYDMRERGVQLRFTSKLRRPFYTQEIRVKQIVENLVSNSVKYADRNKFPRWVEVRVGEVGRSTVRIEVEDNGIGIPSEARSKIYDMFYRVGNSREYGSGLGNYLVKKHVSYLEGRIDYTSSPEGTLFVVEIPNRRINNANDD